MSVKIAIRRTVPMDKEGELLPLLVKMRTLAVGQPGYISGESYRNYEQPEDYVVISTWQSVDDWKKWLASTERNDVQGKIDGLLGQTTEYTIYTYG